MPEGPEVETVVRSLQPLVRNGETELVSFNFDPAGKRSFRKLAYKERSMPDGLELWKQEHEPSLRSIYRVGKRIFFWHKSTKDGTSWFLICGMGLAGWILKNLPSDHAQKHNIFTLFYRSGSVHFFDLRRFGSWYLMEALASVAWQKEHLGVDALSTDPTLTTRVLLSHQSEPRYAHMEIKTALLHQPLVSGFGNIYACEACFEARLNPWKLFKDCTTEEIEKVVRAGHRIMNFSVTRGGTSFRDFKAPDGAPGTTQQFLSVFRQKCCSICTTPIQRVLLKGRGTYFCPTCQHVPG